MAEALLGKGAEMSHLIDLFAWACLVVVIASEINDWQAGVTFYDLEQG